ncbi:MAG: hypothetical protein IBJ08_18570, partial [Pseudomonas sp.]|nr:hypothetical protein [Pseudomonas sp.]
MRVLFLAPALMLLGACASPLPTPDPQQAWVELYSTADTLLMADRLDRRRWPDGRYFQVTPGQHELETRFQFEVRSGGSVGMFVEPFRMSCEIGLRFDDFSGGQRYCIQGG